MPRMLIIIWLLFILPPSAKAQLAKVKEINVESDFFSSDYQNNIYYTTKDSIFKVIPPYDTIYSFSIAGHGPPVHIDVSNPERTILLFSISGEILFLDFSMRQVLNFYLEELGFYGVSAIISGEDRSIWFYNYDMNLLRKLNRNFIPVIDVMELQTYFDRPGQNIFITNYNSHLYINMPSSGILVLDKKGNFETSYSVKGIPDFQVRNDFIYYYRDNMIHRFSKHELKTTACRLPDIPGIINAHYLAKGFAIQTKDKIQVYATENQSDIKFY